jgi:hypothetical protein
MLRLATAEPVDHVCFPGEGALDFFWGTAILAKNRRQYPPLTIKKSDPMTVSTAGADAFCYGVIDVSS